MVSGKNRRCWFAFPSARFPAMAIMPIITAAGIAFGATYYVATSGDNANSGTAVGQPFKTIQKAADVMQAGDTVLIRGGTYRESIVPPRGGASESARITYKAYPGETPIIKGSNQIASWVDQGGNVWKVDLADSYFGSYNPYTYTLNGDYLTSGQNNHTGDVFLNDSIYREYFSLSEVQSSARRWYTSHSGSTTTIYANFGGANPNSQLAEIQTRAFVFFPSIAGLSYITVDSLTMEQAATNWEANNNSQTGLIAINGGLAWIIQNCHIYYSKCAGIACRPNTSSLSSIETYGHHTIRRNCIEKCGEAGICGHNGAIASLIEGNLIQDINSRTQFGGYEGGGIKLHYAIDVTIKDNIIRRISNPPGMTPGIWLDWAGQGTRITGNVIYEAGNDYEGCIYLEGSHGPILIDNNILATKPVGIYGERVVFVHNMIINAGLFFRPGNAYGDRSSQYWVPHTRTSAGSSAWSLTGDRYYNNIFVGNTQRNSETVNNYAGGNNVFYQGAAPFTIVPGTTGINNSSYNTNYIRTDLPNGVRISFRTDNAPAAANCPLINKAFIGTYSVVNQGIENHDGSPITIDKDMLGNSRNTTHPLVGPFETLTLDATNTYTITAGPASGGVTSIGRLEIPAPLNKKSIRINGKSIELPTGIFMMSIFDSKGRIIVSRDRIEKSCQLPLGRMTNGMYIVRIAGVDGVVEAVFRALDLSY